MKAKQFYSSQAWRYCAKYVLLYYANDDGMVQCSTSGVWMPVNSSKAHCGHLIRVHDGTKTNYSTAFEFENLAPQSHQENIYKGGNQLEMYKWLVEKHGQDKMDMLDIKRHNICKLGKFEIDYWHQHYKTLFNELVEKRGFNPWKK